MRATIALFVLLASPFIVNAYPYLWATDVLPNDVLKGASLTPTNCIQHPTTKEGGHGAPIADKTISITTEAGGKPVKELCPGVEHTVTVNYPERRRTLLTSSEGSFDKSNKTCPGRLYTLRTQASYDTFSAKLTVPCNSTADSTTLKVTSATSPSSAYKTASLALPIAALSKCPTSTCPKVANKTLAANKTMAADNETMPMDNDMTSINETISDNNMTVVANETITDSNSTTGGNETVVEEEVVVSDNTTAAGNVSEPAGPNATKGGLADKAADVANATKAAAAAAKAKSAAAASSPAGVLAAACLMAVAAIVL